MMRLHHQDSRRAHWTIDIADHHDGELQRRIPVDYNGPGDSAEWIEELPTAVGTAQPTLANFGSATFTNMSYNPANPAPPSCRRST